jgi:flagellar export protein FliJ
VRRFEFRLERVLKVKQQRQRLAELQQQQARARVETARSVVATLQGEIRETAAAVQRNLGGAQLWLALYERTRILGQALQVAEVKVQQAEAELSEADARRRQIATEVEALLNLRQQQWQRYCQEVARVQQEQLDELGLRQWLAAQDKEDR